jgi:hypothetical protein
LSPSSLLSAKTAALTTKGESVTISENDISRVVVPGRNDDSRFIRIEQPVLINRTAISMLFLVEISTDITARCDVFKISTTAIAADVLFDRIEVAKITAMDNSLQK